MMSIVPFTCAICAVRLSELHGGKCVRCGKIVCRHHFLRGWWKGLGRVCSKCASAPEQEKNVAKK